MKIGDLVKVNTKHHGDKLGIIVKEFPWKGLYDPTWVVHIFDHHTSESISLESDMEIVK